MKCKILLYSTGCPKCRILEKKMHDKQLTFGICSSIDDMQQLGIASLPMLKVDDKLLNYFDAVQYINSL